MEYTEKKATKLKQPLEVPPTCRLIRWEKSIDFDLSRWRDAFWGVSLDSFMKTHKKIHPWYLMMSFFWYLMMSCVFFHIFIVKRYKNSSNLPSGENQETTSSMACGNHAQKPPSPWNRMPQLQHGAGSLWSSTKQWLVEVNQNSRWWF